jgi:hypothetical protein
MRWNKNFFRGPQTLSRHWLLTHDITPQDLQSPQISLHLQAVTYAYNGWAL